MADVTFSEARSLLKYDPDTGRLFWKARPSAPDRWNARFAGKEVGPNSVTHGYKQCVLLGKQYFVHRLIWLLSTGEWPSGHIDHINGDKFDNRISNLRDVTAQENSRNQKMPKSNSSGVMGVYWYKNCRKWNAQIRVDGRLINLGYFSTIEQAATARKEAERIHGFHENHGRF